MLRHNNMFNIVFCLIKTYARKLGSLKDKIWIFSILFIISRENMNTDKC